MNPEAPALLAEFEAAAQSAQKAEDNRPGLYGSEIERILATTTEPEPIPKRFDYGCNNSLRA